jgi:hypothetical protein
MDDATAITSLSISFSKQLQWYEELTRIDQKTLSQLVLSRGDMTPLMTSVRQKCFIIGLIEGEREKIRGVAAFYQENKARIQPSPPKDHLDSILSKSETAMKEFLEGESQLKRYLEFMMEKKEMATEQHGCGQG